MIYPILTAGEGLITAVKEWAKKNPKAAEIIQTIVVVLLLVLSVIVLGPYILARFNKVIGEALAELNRQLIDYPWLSTVWLWIKAHRWEIGGGIFLYFVFLLGGYFLEKAFKDQGRKMQNLLLFLGIVFAVIPFGIVGWWGFQQWQLRSPREAAIAIVDEWADSQGVTYDVEGNKVDIDGDTAEVILLLGIHGTGAEITRGHTVESAPQLQETVIELEKTALGWESQSVITLEAPFATRWLSTADGAADCKPFSQRNVQEKPCVQIEYTGRYDWNIESNRLWWGITGTTLDGSYSIGADELTKAEGRELFVFPYTWARTEQDNIVSLSLFLPEGYSVVTELQVP